MGAVGDLDARKEREKKEVRTKIARELNVIRKKEYVSELIYITREGRRPSRCQTATEPGGRVTRKADEYLRHTP